MSSQPTSSDTPENPLAITNIADRQAKVVVLLVAVVVLLVLVGVVVFLASNPARTANIRDIVLILSAVGLIVVNLAVGLLLVLLIFRLQLLVRLLITELIPLIREVGQDLRQTARTVRGTATFLSDQVAQPTIRLASFLAGLKGAARAANWKVREHLKRR
ncbi:MAG: hypothetical protein ACK4WM_06600 [Thermoflexales bacterium]